MSCSLFPTSAPPPLPVFQSLLVKGPYHPSAPVHLSLSHARQPEATKVVCLVASRAKFGASLKEFNDDWLNKHTGDGATHAATRKVDILYPPTPAHLTFLLSLFHEALFGEEDFLHLKTTFETSPSLLVLCEPSCFFDGNAEATISSYLMLVNQALGTLASLSAKSGKPASLVVFDSGLDQLRLPVLRPVSPLQMEIDEAEEDQPVSPSTYRRESLAFLAQRFFEWLGSIEEEVSSPSAMNEETLGFKRRCTLRLSRELGPRSSNEDSELVWEWTENLTSTGGTTFSW